jgi:hypothetical protein
LAQNLKFLNARNGFEFGECRKKVALGGRTRGMLEAEHGSVANHGELRLGRVGLETLFTRKNPWTIKNKNRKGQSPAPDSTICHSGESRNLSNVNGIPACAGMTVWG